MKFAFTYLSFYLSYFYAHFRKGYSFSSISYNKRRYQRSETCTTTTVMILLCIDSRSFKTKAIIYLDKEMDTLQRCDGVCLVALAFTFFPFLLSCHYHMFFSFLTVTQINEDESTWDVYSCFLNCNLLHATLNVGHYHVGFGCWYSFS